MGGTDSDATLSQDLGDWASSQPWILLENRLGQAQECDDSSNEQDDAEDRAHLAEAAHVRQVALLVRIHSQRLLLEEDTTMVQKDMPDRVAKHEQGAEHDKHRGQPAAGPALRLAVAVACHIDDDSRKKHHVSTKGKMVHPLTVVKSRHLARHAKGSNQQ